MYCAINFKNKKLLKEAVASGKKLNIYQYNDGIFGHPNPEGLPDYTGKSYLEGPWYPQPHKWYAEVQMENGIIIKVK